MRTAFRGERCAVAGNDQKRRVTRGLHQARFFWQTKSTVENHAQRRIFRHSGQTASQKRIVSERGLDADHDGVVLRTQKMHLIAHTVACDRDGPPAGRGHLAIRRNGKLEHDVWAAVLDASNVPGVIAPSECGADTDIDCDA